MTTTPTNRYTSIDPRQGTDSTMAFSHGNTLPVVALPFAMNHWVVETLDVPGPADRWFYSPHHRITRGIRCTHQPSPWIGDYACFRLFPQVCVRDFSEGGLSSSFSPEKTTIEPGFFATYLHRERTSMELAPTERGAVLSLRFPSDSNQTRLIVRMVHGRCRFEPLSDDRTVVAAFHTPNSGVRDDLWFYVALQSSKPFTLNRFGSSDDGVNEGPEAVTGAALEFASQDHSTSDGTTLVHIATSYISGEQALLNLEREVSPHTVETAREATVAKWEGRLGRISISTHDEEQRRTFYSCLYRALLFPNFTHEIDKNGNTVHRSFYTGAIDSGPMVTNNGFWDTVRTVYPFLSLVYPETLGTILSGWVNAAREGAWTPKWPAPGHRGTMIGTHLDAVFADAWTKRIPGWPAEEAYRIARRNAFVVPQPDSPFGRVGLADYLELGYVPEEIHHGASRTMDFAYGDFCLSVLAREFASHEAEQLTARASWWRNIYDPDAGFLRGRKRDGTFASGFDPYRWGGPYVEGSAWQCGLAVYHEPLALGELLATRTGAVSAAAALEAHLDALVNSEPHYDSGHYATEIHEMSEMAAVDFGQYAHSNQPSHHIPFLYTLTKSPWKADHLVRAVLEQLYDASPRGFCGDEDNGEMSSWYLLASMGLYQICPGKPEFSLTAPLFEEVIVNAEAGERLRIVAPGASANRRFLAEPRVNRTPVTGRLVGFDTLRGGGELHMPVGRVPHG